MKPLLVWSMILVLAIPSLSCSEVIRPHVRVPYPTQKGTDTTGNTKETLATDLDSALTFAQGLQDEYLKANANQGAFKLWMPITLLSLSAVTTFYGITGASRSSKDAFTLMSLIGLAGGNAGALLVNDQAAILYTRGAEAVGCAMLYAQPLKAVRGPLGDLLGADHDKSLAEAIEAVIPLADQVDKQIREVQRLEKGNTDAAGAEHSLKEVREVLKKSQETLAAGRALQIRVDAAGGELIAAVTIIQSRIARAVDETLPDLQAIRQAIRSLSGETGGLSALYTGTILAPKSPPNSRPQFGVAGERRRND